MAQGAGNIASGLFRGQPVGGSVGQTALNVSAGARSRWALDLLGPVDARDPPPALGAGRPCRDTDAGGGAHVRGLLECGSVRSRWRSAPGRPRRWRWRRRSSRRCCFPVAAAVGIGVALSLLLQLNREAVDLRVVELRPLPDRRSRSPPPRPRSRPAVTLLDVYGSLYYAGAQDARDPPARSAGSRRAAVIVRLRGRTALGATSLRRPRRLRAAARGRRRTPLPERRRPEPGRAVPPYPQGRHGRRGARLRGRRRHRRFECHAYREAEQWVAEASPASPSDT